MTSETELRAAIEAQSLELQAVREALEECLYEINANKHFAGSVELEPSANTKRIIRKARAALKPSRGATP